jgi:type VI secretion system protein ImpL
MRRLLRFLVSRRLWTFIGVALLCALLWLYGPLLRIGEAAPLSTDLARGIAVGAVLLLWLLAVLLGQIRALRANRAFVTELARPAAPERPGAADEVAARFRSVLEEMKRSKLGGRRFLREMPWYLLIGPPGTGKTTALRQSGLHFPIDLSDDLRGVGGTRNCDWFFTDDAVLLDTAGRWTEQGSSREADAAEWLGFLDLLRQHRGRRALNGVLVAISLRELLGDPDQLRAQGREIRRRLTELRARLDMHLPTYLLVTKADLLPGFETFFADLSTEEREQVWGATFPVEARADGVAVERELHALAERVEGRVAARLAEDVPLLARAETFRFPAHLLKLEAPLKGFVDAVFGETRYDEAPWLRGVYLTSATQEGSPIDRLVGELSGAFGLPVEAPQARRHGERRSYFLRRLLTDVVFREAGLGFFDARAEQRRRRLWQGAVAGSALLTAALAALFVFAYARWSGALADQGRQLAALDDRLADISTRVASTERPDLDLALEAVGEVEAASVVVPDHPLALLGPSGAPYLAQAQRAARERALRNVLEPRMVALLEATMWGRIRDPEFLLGALKTYNMMTGLLPYDRAYVAGWWQESLPGAAPLDPFPTDAALAAQLAALDRLGGEEEKVAPDPELVAAALDSVCDVPLATRAYGDLMSDPAVTALPEWSPASVSGPNAGTVLTRLSGRPLRAGLPGAFTYGGFHGTVLPLVPEVAARASLDRLLFAGGCEDSAGADAETLAAEILRLYEQDFVAQWDALLRDVRLAPITDLRVATDNLKDLASADSALRRLLGEVVAQTDLVAVPAAEEGEAAEGTGVPGSAMRRLGVVGRYLSQGARVAGRVDLPGGSAEDAPDVAALGAATAESIAAHFRPLKAVVASVDDAPPLIEDVTIALGALANELQTVAASPDPEAALQARGGLAELTGAIAGVAAGLPDPIDDWIAGVAAETVAVTRDAVVAQLNARLAADVLPFCRSATTARYPFDAASRNDVRLPDFQRLLGPGGLMDSYIDEQLLPYIDTTTRPWTWRADFGLPPDALAPFERARVLRDALFPGGAGPLIAFTLAPRDLSPNASRVTLNVDGQALVYFNAAAAPVPMTWPGPNGSGIVTLSFAPVDGGAESITTELGDWAFLRLVRAGELAPTDLPDLFTLRLALGGFWAEFDLQAASVENPLDLSLFGGFRCPESL